MTDKDTNAIFIVGAPRSGTTWLQLLLAQHPHIATCQETHLFSAFLSPVLEKWESFADPERPRRVGLPATLDRSDFMGWCEDLAEMVVAQAIDDEAWFLEKTPGHARHGDTLFTFFPKAHVIHLVRDPRKVVASLRTARREWSHEGWTEDWIPMSVADCAELWRDHVRSASGIQARTHRFLELRYEDLLEAPGAELDSVLNWLGLDAARSELRAWVDATRRDRLRTGEAEALPWDLSDEPDDFYRKKEDSDGL